jgi:hypothetical protein
MSDNIEVVNNNLLIMRIGEGGIRRAVDHIPPSVTTAGMNYAKYQVGTNCGDDGGKLVYKKKSLVDYAERRFSLRHTGIVNNDEEWGFIDPKVADGRAAQEAKRQATSNLLLGLYPNAVEITLLPTFLDHVKGEEMHQYAHGLLDKVVSFVEGNFV